MQPDRVLVYCTVAVLQVYLAGAQVPPGEGCPATDASVLSSCLVGKLESLRQYFSTGFPEKGIPPGDPLQLGQISFSPEGLSATYSDVVVRGFSGYQLRTLNVDPAARTVNFDLTVPQVSVTGNYDVVGQFLVARITSNGNFSSLFTGAHVNGKGDLAVRRGSTPSTDVVQMENLKVSLKIDQTQHKIDFSPDTNPIIGETVRHLVTKNDRILLEEVRPEIESKIAEIMSRHVNQVLTVIPVNSLLTERSATAA